MPRYKSRLVFASASEIPTINITDQGWLRIETAFGQQVTLVVRRKVLEKTQKYIERATFEKNASTIPDAIERVRPIEKAAKAFRHAVLSCPTGIHRDADLYARKLISDRLGLSFRGGRNGLQNLALELQRIVAACGGSLRELQQDTGQGFTRGDAWRSWVSGITNIFAAHGLPTAARQDSDKNKSGASSHFVDFFRELQNCIPKEFRQSHARSSSLESNIALATAIKRARRNSGHRHAQTPKKKTRQGISPHS